MEWIKCGLRWKMKFEINWVSQLPFSIIDLGRCQIHVLLSKQVDNSLLIVNI